MIKKEFVNVYARIRPFISNETNKIRWIDIKDNLVYSTNESNREFCYKFDKVFNEISQQNDIYNSCNNVINDALMGYNCTIFA